ncbi:Ig-like domain-containing protein [Candidatus Woesearchaeota archaeon]|nr:Ig-like domain-containing protein [Candidatus Woesearchaeota archaeon]
MHHDKKGQVTLFIILGFLLLSSLAFFLIIRGLNSEKQKEVLPVQAELSTATDAVNQYVLSCLKTIGEEGLTRLGIQGGYLSLNLNYLSTPTYNTTYLYYNGEVRMPELSVIEAELAQYIDSNLEICTNFSILPEVQVTAANQSKTRVTISTKEVSLVTQWDLSVTKGQNVQDRDRFTLALPVEFYDIFTTVSAILNATAQHPSLIDNYLLLQQNVSFIDYLLYDNDTVIYLLREDNARIKGKPYYFLFAAKTLPMGVPVSPRIQPVPLLEGTVGETFHYEVLANDPEGGDLFYGLQSPLFSIDNKTGIIHFIPTTFHKGDHVALLTVTTSRNVTNSMFLRFHIEGTNRPPVVIVRNQTVVYFQSLHYTPYTYDEESTQLTFYVVDAPEGVTMAEATGEITWTPHALGNYTITFGVNDSLAQTEAMFVVKVIP